VWARGKAREQEDCDETVARHGNEQGDQAHQLKPVTRRNAPTPGAYGLFGKEV
jgi:hypothetical protein